MDGDEINEEGAGREEGELSDDSATDDDSNVDEDWISFTLSRFRNAVPVNTVHSAGHLPQQQQPPQLQHSLDQQQSRPSYAQRAGQNLMPLHQQRLSHPTQRHRPSSPRGHQVRHPPPSPRSHPRTASNSVGQNERTDNVSRTNSGRQYNPYLRKKQKKNTIIDDGNEDIPFTAMRELYSYEAFVTNIDPLSDIEDIKGHLKRKLCTDEVYLKPMSKSDAKYFSFGIFCRSRRDNLDLRMPGLWPRGTRIYKWNSKASVGRVGNQTTSNHSHHPSHGSQRSYPNGSSHRQGHQNMSANNYRYRSPDQQRLHDQHV